MSVLDQASVEQAFAKIQDPETGRSALQLERLQGVQIQGDSLTVDVGITSFALPLAENFKEDVVNQLRQQFPQLKQVNVQLHVQPSTPEKLGEIGLPSKGVIAVGSGKGGVGKSTIAACLAVGLRDYGCRVGLMDADVYGPSVPHLFGTQLAGQPQLVDKKIVPVDVGGLKLMSMGYMVPPGQAVVWRGPMLHGAITQFLRDTAWGELDYLIIDMPPGTGDIALTLSQILPLTGAVVVCTPQDVALIDAVKAIAMFRKVNIPVLGMVENMSYFLCPDNGKRYNIFGHGGARAKAEELEVPFLGEVPINIGIRERGDSGETVANLQHPETAETFRSLAHRLVKQICDSRKVRPALPTLNVL